MKLGVALQSAGEFQATSSQVSLAGLLNLQLTGTAANPVIVGRADLTSGEMFFMNRRYEIQRATATFARNRTVPDLNVLVTTVINQYNVSISLLGTPDRLQTSYVSDPPLPPVDVIDLIALGQTTEQQAANPGNLGPTRSSLHNWRARSAAIFRSSPAFPACRLIPRWEATTPIRARG